MTETWLKRSALRDAYDASVTDAVTLYAKLRELQDAALATTTAVASGVESAKANGHEVSFAQVSDSQRSLIGRNTEVYEELVTLHESVQEDLGGTPTDLEIKNEMLAQLQPAYEVGLSTISALRCA